jgi:hypothetical protein
VSYADDFDINNPNSKKYEFYLVDSIDFISQYMFLLARNHKNTYGEYNIVKGFCEFYSYNIEYLEKSLDGHISSSQRSNIFRILCVNKLNIFYLIILL